MSDLEYKSFSTKGSDFDTETGVFTCFPSLFNVMDSHRDITHPGAFKKTIQENGHRVKLFFNHSVFDMPIGKPIEQREVPRDMLPDEILERAPEVTGGLFVRNRLSPTSQGKDVHILLRDGVLKEMSYGFNAIKVDFDEDENQRPFRNLREARIWEFTIANWGSAENALITDVKNQDHESKGAIGYKKRPLADRGMSWDGPAQVKKASTNAALRAIHTWVDDSAEADDEGNLPKSAFKLPHHVGTEPFNTVWRGVTAAMAALFGARATLKVPDSDRRGIFNHLARHYRADFSEEPPAFKDYIGELEYTDDEIGVICKCEPDWFESESNELEAIESITARLEQRRRILIPRPNILVPNLKLRALETEFSMLDTIS
jgi:uncharacterized protein